VLPSKLAHACRPLNWLSFSWPIKTCLPASDRWLSDALGTDKKLPCLKYWLLIWLLSLRSSSSASSPVNNPGAVNCLSDLGPTEPCMTEGSPCLDLDVFKRFLLDRSLFLASPARSSFMILPVVLSYVGCLDASINLDFFANSFLIGTFESTASCLPCCSVLNT